MEVTEHAKGRVKERLGFNKKTIESAAKRALEKGIQHKDTVGSFNKYFSSLYLKHKKANNIRVFAEMAFLFRNQTLITVFAIPHKFKKVANKLKKKKEQ